MKFDPINGYWDLVVTDHAILNSAMKLFAGYRTTEYHRFISPHACKQWLELDVNVHRTKILVYLPMDDIKYRLPKSYYDDFISAKHVYVGLWKEPKFYVGDLAVYMPTIFLPMFPIGSSSHANDYLVVGTQTPCGLYRALNIANKHAMNPEAEVV